MERILYTTAIPTAISTFAICTGTVVIGRLTTIGSTMSGMPTTPLLCPQLSSFLSALQRLESFVFLRSFL